MVDHDRLFKELLSTFFPDFLALFAPALFGEVEPASVEFLEKELYTDVVAGERHEVDLLVKLRRRGQDSFVLVHVENQATAEAEFERRMFRYFARIEARHPNPVAAALMSRMRIPKQERPRAKLECLRMLATLRLDPARTRLISGFLDTYLQLKPHEQKLFASELESVPEEEKGNVMEIVTSWMEEGIEKGRELERQEGTSRLLRQVARRCGPVPPELASRVRALEADALDRLAEQLLDFSTLADLEHWLANERS